MITEYLIRIAILLYMRYKDLTLLYLDGSNYNIHSGNCIALCLVKEIFGVFRVSVFDKTILDGDAFFFLCIIGCFSLAAFGLTDLTAMFVDVSFFDLCRKAKCMLKFSACNSAIRHDDMMFTGNQYIVGHKIIANYPA